MSKQLQATIDAAWEKRDGISSATKGEVREAVETAIAGLDDGSFRTAEKVGDEWVVNGQKVWTSLAHYSDMIFVVARSEEGSAGPKGLSFLLMDMDQPGIEVRPIRQINGEAEFNETFLTDARCAADAMLGAAGEGCFHRSKETGKAVSQRKRRGAGGVHISHFRSASVCSVHLLAFSVAPLP